MNKLFTKVATLCVGLAMAAGVGVAVGASHVSEVKATEAESYKLDGMVQATGTAYNGDNEVTQGGVKWIVNGNVNQTPWRVGGKNTNGLAEAGAIRKIWSQDAVTNETVSKVVITTSLPANNSLSATSVELKVGSAAGGSDESTATGTFGNSIVFECPSNADWSSKYFEFDFVMPQNNTGTQKFFQVSSIVFYYESTTPRGTLEITDVPHIVEVGDEFTPSYNWTPEQGSSSTIVTSSVDYTASDSEVLTKEGSTFTAAKAGFATVTLTATDSVSEEYVSVSHKVYVTNPYNFSVGDSVALCAPDAKQELSSISDGNTPYGVGAEYTENPAGAYELEVQEGSLGGSFAFRNEDGFLSWSAGNSLTVENGKTENSAWYVVVYDSYMVIKNCADDTREIWWNSGTPRFACYTNKTPETSGYNSVDLYILGGQPIETKYEVSFYEGNTGYSSEYVEGAKVIMPQPTESLIPEGMAFDYWSHKETGDHYAPGEEFTVGANNARFDAIYKAIEPVPTDWTDNEKDAFKAALDQFVPPYFKEPTSVSIEGNTVTVSYDGKLDEELEEYFVEPEWTVVQTEVGAYLKKVTTNGEIRVTIGGQVGEVTTTVLTYSFVESAPSEDWDDDLKTEFSEALDGFVPPFIAAFSGEDVFTISDGQAYGMVAGDVVSDVTAAFVNAGYGEPGEKQGLLGYEIPTTNGTVTAGYMYYEQLQSTYLVLMYEAAPTGSWSDEILQNFADELHGVVPTYDDAVASLAYVAKYHDFEMPTADQETAQGYLDILCNGWEYYDQGGFYYYYTEDGLGYVKGYLYPESQTTYSATIVFVQTTYDQEQSQAFENVLGVVPPFISGFPQFVYDSNSGMFASKVLSSAQYLSDYQEEIEYYNFVLVSTEAATRFVYNGGQSGYYDGTAYCYAAQLQDGGLLVMELFVIQNYYLTLNIYYAPQALSISVGGDYKTVYEYGEEFDSTGIVVTAAMSDGSSLDVTSEVEFSGFDSSVIGEQTITVTLSDLSTSFTVTVNKPAYDAEAFAQELLDEIAPICANYDGKKSNKSALTSVWTKMALKYNSLTNEEKAKLAATVGKQGGNTLERAIAFYNYACKKYGLTKFIVGQKAQALVSEQPSTNNNILPIIVIVASSVAAVTAIGVVIGLKRRKNSLVK